MINSFGNRRTKDLFEAGASKGFPADIVRRAYLLMVQLHAAAKLMDMASPPGNKLKALAGNRAGQHAVRINDKWRLVFRWDSSGASDVEVTNHYD